MRRALRTTVWSSARTIVVVPASALPSGAGSAGTAARLAPSIPDRIEAMPYLSHGPTDRHRGFPANLLHQLTLSIGTVARRMEPPVHEGRVSADATGI